MDHKIVVINTEPVMIKQYLIPFNTEKTNKEKVEKMSSNWHVLANKFTTIK